MSQGRIVGEPGDPAVEPGALEEEPDEKRGGSEQRGLEGRADYQ
jgi:hypothetical protein